MTESDAWLDRDRSAVAAAAGRRADTLAVAELTQAEFATVRLSQRVQSSLGHLLELECRDGTRLTGKLVDAGRQWLMLIKPGSEVLVRLDSVTALVGLSRHASATDIDLTPSLGIGAVFRVWSDQRARVRFGLVHGQVEGTISRVGMDAIDVTTHPLDRPPTLVDNVVVVPTHAVNWVAANN